MGCHSWGEGRLHKGEMRSEGREANETQAGLVEPKFRARGARALRAPREEKEEEEERVGVAETKGSQ